MNEVKRDLKSLCVRLVGWFAKGMKINNMLVLAVISPAYLAFIWAFCSFRIYTMFSDDEFLWGGILGTAQYPLLWTLGVCTRASLFILWPLCRILQLAWPNVFEPALESNDEE